MNSTEPTIRLNDRAYALTDLDAYCWDQLVAAPGGKKESTGFKTGTLATRTDTGADARTVVLREASNSEKVIWFHSDRRAPKLNQLRNCPVATVLFWDDASQIQLRLTVTTTIHLGDAIADDQWARLWVGSRKMYLSEEVPGSEQAGPYPGFPNHFGEALLTEADSEAGRVNFAVVQCQVSVMEFLRLSRSGQSRARFQYVPEPRFRWLAP